jgi:hypothetical protein
MIIMTIIAMIARTIATSIRKDTWIPKKDAPDKDDDCEGEDTAEAEVDDRELFNGLGAGVDTGVGGGVVDDFVVLPVELETGGALYLVFVEFVEDGVVDGDSDDGAV